MANPRPSFLFSCLPPGFGILTVFLLTEAILVGPAFSTDEARQTKSENSVVATAAENTIPAGTILPVILSTSISFEKCKPGQAVRGRIAQVVPLPNGAKIHRGAAVAGQVAEVTPGANGSGRKVAIQFDEVYMAGQWVHVVTNLRAIAGFVAVQQASVPTEAPAEGSPYDWLPTMQIGGDSVYGRGGPVMSAEHTSKVIGRSVENGVLVQVSAKAGTNCRGDGTDNLQALWVFSGNACGTYGIEHLKIDHAGRTDPKGTIVLASESPKLKLSEGDGLLLRVD
jgi:hypothetical protein